MSKGRNIIAKVNSKGKCFFSIGGNGERINTQKDLECIDVKRG